MMVALAVFAQLAATCAPNVAPETLAAIATTESGFDVLAIHDNTTSESLRPTSLLSAVQEAEARIGTARHSVDLGLMQINGANLPVLHMTIADAFNPCRSMAGGATLLAAAYDGGNTEAAQQRALRVALSRYNTGDAARGFANGYVHRVELAATRRVPALKVDGTAPASAPAPGAIADPNAPPAWDVWAEAAYAETHGNSWDASPDLHPAPQNGPASLPLDTVSPPETPPERGSDVMMLQPAHNSEGK